MLTMLDSESGKLTAAQTNETCHEIRRKAVDLQVKALLKDTLIATTLNAPMQVQQRLLSSIDLLLDRSF